MALILVVSLGNNSLGMWQDLPTTLDINEFENHTGKKIVYLNRDVVLIRNIELTGKTWHTDIDELVFNMGDGYSEAEIDFAMDYCNTYNIPWHLVTFNTNTQVEARLSCEYVVSKGYAEPNTYSNEITFTMIAQDNIFAGFFKPKKFVTLNRNLTSHRFYKFLDMWQKGILEDCHFSFGGALNAHHLSPNVPSKDILDTWIDQCQDSTIAKFWSDHSEEFFQNIPYTLPGESNVSSQVSTEFFVRAHHESHWACVNDETQNFQLILSEKVSKTMYYKLPFVAYAVPNYLKYLRELGFRTFGDFIDEDYDHTECDYHRARLVNNEMQKICAMSEAELIQMRFDMDDIIEHNYKLVHDRLFNPEKYKTVTGTSVFADLENSNIMDLKLRHQKSA